MCNSYSEQFKNKSNFSVETEDIIVNNSRKTILSDVNYQISSEINCSKKSIDDITSHPYDPNLILKEVRTKNSDGLI